MVDKIYLKQYDRMKRWYDLFKEINDGKQNDSSISSDYDLDIVYAFFLNCYHLRDWIYPDPNGDNQSDYDEVINNQTIKICKDVCNHSKHSVIDDTVTGDKKTDIKNINYSVDIGPNGITSKTKYIIKSNNKTYDAFEIATGCINFWDKFLRDKNLL